MAGYVIHTPAVEGTEAAARAAELGPTYVAGPASPTELARLVGFEIVADRDLTAEFRTTAAAFLQARSELEAELRAAVGDAAFEDERSADEKILIGIDEGLLLRSMVLVGKPLAG